MKKNLLVLILWILFLFSVLLSPVTWWRVIPGPWGVINFDKIAHVCLFAITGFVTIFGTDFLRQLRNRVILALIAGLILSGVTEVAQHFIAHRIMDIYDFLANIVGLGFGLLFYNLLYRRHIVR
jgi:VanZ family protein